MIPWAANSRLITSLARDRASSSEHDVLQSPYALLVLGMVTPDTVFYDPVQMFALRPSGVLHR